MKLGSIKERECNDMIKNRIRLLPVLLLAVWVLAGCGHQVASADKASDGRLQVVTTLFPQYDFARQIGGDHADVSLVLLPGMESHMYDPTPGDMIRISEADMFIYTGARWSPGSGAGRQCRYVESKGCGCFFRRFYDEGRR